MTRRVLMIAYYFPPSLEVGRIRTVKFCKYLPEFGWQPVVVTCLPPPAPGSADEAEIPPLTEVHRVGYGTLLQRGRTIGAKFRNAILGLWRPAATPLPGGTADHSVGLSSRFKAALCWPDLQATWILRSTRPAMRLAHDCNAIYSSGWPMSGHLVARRVARATGLPWIMDMRDPWMLATQQYPLGFQRRFFRRAERRCLEQCFRMLNVNEDLTAAYRAAYPDVPPDRFATIENGADPPDFDGLPPPPPGPPLRLAYAGNFYGGRSPLPLIEAVGHLKQAGTLSPADLHVTLMGGGAPTFAKTVARLGAEEFFTLLPRGPYREALALLSSSHGALLFLGDRVDQTAALATTKIYDACYLGKPLLAVIPRVPMWNTLEAAGATCADGGDAEAVRRTLQDLVGRFRTRGELPPPLRLPEAAQRTRRAQAERLAAILEAAVR